MRPPAGSEEMLKIHYTTQFKLAVSVSDIEGETNSTPNSKKLDRS
jgi:hypothetical protein